MKTEKLVKELKEMMKQTEMGRLNWIVETETTDADPLERKERMTEDGKEWVVDQCFTSFSCRDKNREFCLITHELIRTSGDKVKTTNLAFLPPTYQRVFELNLLAPYAVEMDQMLALTIHQLWELLLTRKKAGKPGVMVRVVNGEQVQAV